MKDKTQHTQAFVEVRGLHYVRPELSIHSPSTTKGINVSVKAPKIALDQPKGTHQK